MTEEDGISIRDYIDTQFRARDELCLSRSSSCAHHLNSLIEQLEKRFETVFNLMDKAITKAEVAQRDYNEKSNEFRGALDDQAKQLMPRAENQLLINGLNERIDMILAEVNSLREFRSETGGRGVVRHETWGYAVGLVALLFSLASIVLLVVREIRFG